MQRRAVRLLVSAASAIGLTLLVYAVRPSGLDVRTDIVGYPTFANFDIDRYLWGYGLLVVFLPVVTIGLYVATTRLFVGRLGPWRPLPAPLRHIEEIPTVDGWRTWAVGVGRTLFVGTVVGLEVAVVLGLGWEVMAAMGVGYAAGVSLAGWVASRSGRHDRVAVMSALNTLATPFVVAGLWGLSRSTEVEVAFSGEVHRYPWLPAWVAVAASVGLLLVLAVALRRRRGRAAIQSLERVAVLLVAAPVALFVFMSALPGDLGTFDAYEEGQALAAAELVREGAFPWRDLMVSHGLMSDVVRGVLGFAVFDESRWGLVAGDSTLLIPLAWVALYYLCAYLFWTNWLYLLGTQLVVITGHVTAIEIRMLLVPCALLLLAALLERPTVLRIVVFTTVVAAQVLVTPEALVVVVALLVTLAAFEFSDGKRGRRLVAAYPRTMGFLAVGAAIALAWSVVLASFGALGDWVFSHAATIPGHRLTGGIEPLVAKTEFEVIAPIALVLVVFAFLTVWVRSRRPFAYADWVMVAMAIFTLLYYPKFLSRADPYHLAQSFVAAVPLLLYVAFRGITFAEAWLAALAGTRSLGWFPRRHTLTVPLLLALLFTAPVPLHDAVRSAPRHFVAAVAAEPENARIGYARAGENDLAVLGGLDESLVSLLGPGDTVFDFSNAPGIFHFLLDQMPSTRYYHVSYAIRQRTQSDLVRRLQANEAGAVVLTRIGPLAAGFNSAPNWDRIPNQVRHYDVSQFLLDHYVPVTEVGGFVLMAPRDRGARPDRDLYFRNYSCDWGYMPNRFAPMPAPSAEAVSLPFRQLEPQGNNERTEYSVTIPPDASGYRWFEVRTGRPLGESNFLLADRRGLVPHSPRAIYFKTLDRGETVVRVKVGSCSQWRGYQPGTLFLSMDGDQDIREIRLVERSASAP